MPMIQFKKKKNGKELESTFLHVKVKVIFTQSSLILCNPMDCSPPSCSDHGILQAGILEWVARDQTFFSHVSCIGRWVLYH